MNEFKLRGGVALVYLQWSSISQKSERSKGQRGPQPQQSLTHPPVWSWSAVNVNCRSAAPSFYLFSYLLLFLQFTSVLSPRSSSLCFCTQQLMISQQRLRNCYLCSEGKDKQYEINEGLHVCVYFAINSVLRKSQRAILHVRCFPIWCLCFHAVFFSFGKFAMLSFLIRAFWSVCVHIIKHTEHAQTNTQMTSGKRVLLSHFCVKYLAGFFLHFSNKDFSPMVNWFI